MIQETKACTKCKIEYPRTLEHFYPRKKTKDGLGSWCKKCRSKHHKKYRQENRDKVNKINNKYYQKNKERIVAKNHGLHQKDVNIMLKKQENRCKICGIFINKYKDIISDLENSKKKYHIDHNHKTGKVRGLLCQKCNHGLGLFNDNPLILAKASKYLIYTTHITPS